MSDAKLRLAFMGSPAFAVPALRGLHDAGHDIAAVYCQPPRPAGRGQAPRRCPVHIAADALGLSVRHPAKLRNDAAEHAVFAALDLDVAVVAAYGLILPQAMLDAPRRGCLNIHASLLPRWRGAAPIQAAILAGDSQSGVTIMQMEAGLDTGPMLRAATTPIGLRTTTPELHDALAEIGKTLIVQVLRDSPAPVPQPQDGVTYAAKLTRADSRIDWTRPAIEIDRQIRALTPWPGTETTLDKAPLKIHAASLADQSGPPGQVLDHQLTVACGTGALRLTDVQLPNRATQKVDAFLRGRPIPPGSMLG